jgi:hypothetical protein
MHFPIASLLFMAAGWLPGRCHLKLAADPPPIAPARARQATFDWVA